MTAMLSFRTDEQLAAALAAEVVRSGRSRSDLLNQALRALLYRITCERDAEVYSRIPLTAQETAAWTSEAWTEDDPGTDWCEVFGA